MDLQPSRHSCGSRTVDVNRADVGKYFFGLIPKPASYKWHAFNGAISVVAVPFLRFFISYDAKVNRRKVYSSVGLGSCSQTYSYGIQLFIRSGKVHTSGAAGPPKVTITPENSVRTARGSGWSPPRSLAGHSHSRSTSLLLSVAHGS
ncbi:uncharacterized protein BO96DRAFT_351381 [Aspergillus niger CBS 101883]|uniref:Uncharacterized protein n=2 Tax=Aspergillus niger TaxID=5061 RepID=A2QJP5_ASPNC|nr:uncharacterized protein BO96DRAFT_351381 [Aspergillus niger CBS 101883]XP_059603669.1 hypothetical protein An04g07790 [Aspergillus niger]PYH50924.1 hypothetical protein BO96DRAFT_351381 [Aspergillus niger CBS 101883]CAK44760.1 hypothetical protein An04g07790 [Aspergillus niger]